MLERRIHRRDLLDVTGEARQYRFHVGLADLAWLHLQYLALGIAGGGGHAQACLGDIGLVGIEQVLGKFRRLAQA